MGLREIMWSQRAMKGYKRVLWWLDITGGNNRADNFYREMMRAVEMLSATPEKGTLNVLFSTPRRRYYSYVVHGYEVMYRYTQSALYVLAIRSTMTREYQET